MPKLATISSSLLLTLALSIGAALAKGPAPELDVDVEIDVGEPVMIAGEPGKAYIQIAIEGFAPPANQRTPVNLALVIDRSGSMRGDRLEKAKEAALMVVDRLSSRDILSVVTYDSTVEILMPPTRLTNRERIRRKIMAITDRGSTALFAGVSTGIDQVRRNFNQQRVNRVILLSDGKANVGPRSPAELAELGIRAGGFGIPITTIGLGLGYNEDLMTQLALSSDGNHGFAENADDLHAIFGNELGDVLSVVAQDVIIELEFETGIKPLRGLNRPVSINGRKATLKLNQIYGKQTKNVILEVEVPAGRAGTQRKLADVGVRYRNLYTKKTRTVRARPVVSFTSSRTEVEKRAKKKVMVTVVEALANEQQKQAIVLRDQGKVKAAQAKLRKTSEYLKKEGRKYDSDELEEFADEAAGAAAEVDDDGEWRKNRKKMRKSVHEKASSQSW